MSDIVERLRAAPGWTEPQPFEQWREAAGLCVAAADEIERLQANWDGCADTCSRLHKEIDQLQAERDALQAKQARMEAYIAQAHERDSETISTLRAERDALKADAERYRWLRDHPTQWSWNPDPNAYKGKVVGFTGRDTRYCDSTLEAAIDAARKA
jgi:hypothetical protein